MVKINLFIQELLIFQAYHLVADKFVKNKVYGAVFNLKFNFLTLRFERNLRNTPVQVQTNPYISQR